MKDKITTSNETSRKVTAALQADMDRREAERQAEVDRRVQR